MSEYSSLKDISAPIETGFFTADWELSEKNFAEDSAVFDGKIIARMPDLGSNGFAKSIKRPETFAAVQTLYKTALALFQKSRVKMSEQGKIRILAGNRRKLFHNITIFGVVVLFCGIGVLFFDKSPKEETEVVQTVSEPVIPVDTMPTLADSFAPAVTTPESGYVSPMPVASADKMADDVPQSPVTPPIVNNANSPWDRPVANSYPSLNTAVHQSVPASQPAITDSSATVAMVPMTPLVSSVSPYEQQLVTQQQQELPVRPPVETYVGQYGQKVQGMMPMHERLENVMNGTQQNIRQATPSYSSQSQYPPQPAGNAHGGNYPQHPAGQHGQYGQYSQYVNQPPQSNTPIPAGRSTLPPQGYYPAPVQNPPNSFYGTAPPTYRRVY